MHTGPPSIPGTGPTRPAPASPKACALPPRFDQRELVRLSLLYVRRPDAPTHRRWA